MTKTAFVIALAGSLTLAAASVSAKEFNQRPHLDSGSQSRVNSAFAKTFLTRGEARRLEQRSSDCGNVSIGNVDPGNGQAPREIIVVAKNVINVVGAGGCR